MRKTGALFELFLSQLGRVKKELIWTLFSLGYWCLGWIINLEEPSDKCQGNPYLNRIRSKSHTSFFVFATL